MSSSAVTGECIFPIPQNHCQARQSLAFEGMSTVADFTSLRGGANQRGESNIQKGRQSHIHIGAPLGATLTGLYIPVTNGLTLPTCVYSDKACNF